MLRMLLVPIGPMSESLAGEVARFLAERLQGTVRVGGIPINPDLAFDPIRVQYNCRPLLASLEDLAGPGELVLGITGIDLFSPVFTFVFGEARLGGAAGLFSINRLKTSFYGLPEDSGRLLARARTEALHETGHLLGLVHCRNGDCVMRFSAAAEEIDLKSDRFCTECHERSMEGRPRNPEPLGTERTKMSARSGD
jgi:archaemetzincin